jgi:deazaflavin-dependent oxidoreductase (nitroreductase family)
MDAALPRLGANLYRALNAFVEPVVRAGAGSPCLLPTGLIVLEATGRRSGAQYRTPLVATAFGEYLFVATLRGERSQWIKNLRASPDVQYWAGGRVHEVRALVFTPGEPVPDSSHLPPAVRDAAHWFWPFTRDADVPFAVLGPRTSKETLSRKWLNDAVSDTSEIS